MNLSGSGVFAQAQRQSITAAAVWADAVRNVPLDGAEAMVRFRRLVWDEMDEEDAVRSRPLMLEQRLDDQDWVELAALWLLQHPDVVFSHVMPCHAVQGLSSPFAAALWKFRVRLADPVLLLASESWVNVRQMESAALDVMSRLRVSPQEVRFAAGFLASDAAPFRLTAVESRVRPVFEFDGVRWVQHPTMVERLAEQLLRSL